MAGTKDKYRAIAPYFTKKPVAIILSFLIPFFFKQKTAYDMAQCDWSSDVCSSDLLDDQLVAREIRLDVPSDELIVEGDQGYLELIVGNLLGNADKYSPDPEPIDVVVRRVRQEARVTV